VPLAKLAAKVMLGKTLKELGFLKEINIPYYTVKEAVFPFVKFPNTDPILGPEMKSTGEAMGIDFPLVGPIIKLRWQQETSFLNQVRFLSA